MGELIELFGRAFILTGFLPAFVFVAVNRLLLSSLAPELWATISRWLDLPLLGSDLTVLAVLPIALGIVLLALNTQIVRFYEGAYGFQRRFLLRPFMQRNRRRYQQLYGNLRVYRETYAKEKDRFKRTSLLRAMREEHRRVLEESEEREEYLPFDENRLLPTRLGNVWATVEEYPATRYGMDGMTFWPRLLAVIPEEYSRRIGSEKLQADFLLNLSLVSGLLGVEMLALGPFTRPWLMLLGPVGLLLAYFFYRTAVTATQTLGELIKSCYDLYRGDLLEKLGIARPDDIGTEIQIWRRLGQYFFAGEGAYYPRREFVDDLPDDIARLKEIRNRYERNLFQLEETRARYGLDAPLGLINQIEYMQEQIKRLDERIKRKEAMLATEG